MSVIPQEDCAIFVIRTDAYAGNFEREMTAFITGQLGDCEVGKEHAALASSALAPSDLAWFEENVLPVPDEHGTSRPCAIWQVPGDKCREEANSYSGVAIFFTETPSSPVLMVMQQRARLFAERSERFRPPFQIHGFQLFRHRVVYERTDLPLPAEAPK